ncbi:hypothetical protein FHS29_001375 [Saccharothrix tamanrassetensis]|uniref:Uncharacterized protein n=1 Tax=Saccharothrix tamanrassetensis TaxID=1051531 RepID=A0A841CFL5_9PSEU|nr:hypothetical protein [Saccharothrix tamanrassetensis]MBB5954805.1 hypothetical protein [Saccharothrix tamanrassetensis]
MNEIWIVLAALAVGVVLGAFVPVPGLVRTSRKPEAAHDRNRLRELLNAADDLEYGLNTVLNFGPLSASELTSVDLPAKFERVVRTGLVDRDTLHGLRTHTERIALHPYPEPRELLSAVREDDASVWLVLREAVGSGAAQHLAAAKARECLDVIRDGLRRDLDVQKELVSV